MTAPPPSPTAAPGVATGADVEAIRARPRVLLVGEHDKGLGEPFHPSTVSGARLRAIAAAAHIEPAFANMHAADAAAPTKDDVDRLRALAATCLATVLLGARVHVALTAEMPEALRLLHPAARSAEARKSLRDGLVSLGWGLRNAHPSEFGRTVGVVEQLRAERDTALARTADAEARAGRWRKVALAEVAEAEARLAAGTALAQLVLATAQLVLATATIETPAAVVAAAEAIAKGGAT